MEPLVQLGRYDDRLKITNVGLVDLRRSVQELRECLAAATHNDVNAEKFLSATTLLLSRTDADFLDISCFKNGRISILSDRICPTRQSIWSRLFRAKSTFSMTIDQQSAEKVILNYFTLSRADFEQAYQEHLIH